MIKLNRPRTFFRKKVRGKKNLIILFILILSLFLIGNFALAEDSKFPDKNPVCMVYFTGVGCSHCANTDLLVLRELLEEYPNLIVIEYEIYQQKINAPLIQEYNENYNSGLGIPLVILTSQEHIVGDRPILRNVKESLTRFKENPCLLVDGTSQGFENLNLANLPGQPKIWTKDRILIKTDKQDEWVFGWRGGAPETKNSQEVNPHDILQELIESKDVQTPINKIHYTSIKKGIAVPLSGRYVGFNNAIEFKTGFQREVLVDRKLTLAKIISLAGVDAVNPCALAVLTLMLVAILTYNPGRRRDILLAGLAFVVSVFIMYLIYGFIIVKSFQVISALTSVRLWLYKILGGGAILLGILNIKDFIKYKPGGFLTEMPMFLRPKVKSIISGITSPKGAFLMGVFVTLFLLPCTIGPYIICGGILCSFGMLKFIPWLLLYNLIFILPMLVIVSVVYFGTAKIEDVSGWKERNIKYLHLIAGLVILGLGIAMILGLV